MSYDKYERGCQHLNGAHQRITYRTKTNTKIIIILTLRLTQSNQWVEVGHAARIGGELLYPIIYIIVYIY